MVFTRGSLDISFKTFSALSWPLFALATYTHPAGPSSAAAFDRTFSDDKLSLPSKFFVRRPEERRIDDLHKRACGWLATQGQSRPAAPWQTIKNFSFKVSLIILATLWRFSDLRSLRAGGKNQFIEPERTRRECALWLASSCSSGGQRMEQKTGHGTGNDKALIINHRAKWNLLIRGTFMGSSDS